MSRKISLLLLTGLAGACAFPRAGEVAPASMPAPSVVQATASGIVPAVPAGGGAASARPVPRQGPDDWRAADARALSAPRELARDPAALAAYLVRGATTDAEKARSIFRWIAENIAYDYDAIGSPGPVDAGEVLVRGRSVCQGYSSAFELLGRLAGLEVVTIQGWAKGYAYAPGARFQAPNHAWNAVRLDGQWRLVDSTWGAGYVRAGRFVKELDDFFFLPDPDALAFTHLAQDGRWALGARPQTLGEFEAQPVARSAFFRAGFTAADAREALATPAAAALVDVFLSPGEALRVRAAPARHVLAAGRSYRFELRAPSGSSVALVNRGRWHYLAEVNGVYAGSITPRSGDVALAVRAPAARGGFRTLLRYEAK